MKTRLRGKLPIAALSLLGMASSLSAAQHNGNKCAPTPPASCNPDACKHCYCLGPENYGVNAPARPRTCNGDFVFTIAGFYWNAHQDGMEYAISNDSTEPNATGISSEQGRLNVLGPLNNLFNAKFHSPKFDWNWGFKVGVGYNSTCDGWDLGVLWTWYQGKAHDTISNQSFDDNLVFLPLWSAYSPAIGHPLFTNRIDSDWTLELNLIDIELGREYWVSKYVTMRPHVGIRVAWIEQEYDLTQRGGTYAGNPFKTAESNQLPQVVNRIDLDNDFKGAGIRAGLDTVWNLGCGWGVFGNFAASIIYGRFSVDYDEENRDVEGNHLKTLIGEVDNGFRASRAITDLALGVQWHTMFCDCQYGFTAMLAYEQHLFFNQNQFWRINRVGSVYTDGEALNNSGENFFFERRGNLDTQGVTLTLKFEF